MVSGIGQF